MMEQKKREGYNGRPLADQAAQILPALLYAAGRWRKTILKLLDAWLRKRQRDHSQINRIRPQTSTTPTGLRSFLCPFLSYPERSKAMYINTFKYKPEYVSCVLCTEYVKKLGCTALSCPCLAERMEAGTVGYCGGRRGAVVPYRPR
jgi:hypothetical protein